MKIRKALCTITFISIQLIFQTTLIIDATENGSVDFNAYPTERVKSKRYDTKLIIHLILIQEKNENKAENH